MGFASEIVMGGGWTGRLGDQRDTTTLSISFLCTHHVGQSRPGEKVEFGKVAGEVRREGKNPSTENRRAGSLPPREKVPEEVESDQPGGRGASTARVSRRL